ncbi:MAG: glycosyltransferase [Cyclobacteriaceae bacterium]|nr:glycosyltransferase [Cyclobacteriaceae bacterium]
MERASVNLSNLFHSAGFQVAHVLILRKPHFFKLPDTIPLAEPENFNITHLSLIKTIWWLRKCIKRNEPSGVIVFSKLYASLVCLSLIFTRIPIILSERSSPLYPWPFKFRVLHRIAFRLKRPKGVICQTTIAKQYQQKYYSSKTYLTVIPNVLRDVRRCSEIKREQIVLAVGRFNEALKGFDRLVNSFARIRNKDWILVFAGGDENGEYLKKQAERLGILENVKFLGKVVEIDSVYASAGIFVIPSRSEGYPNALVEAMAAGLPCIAFDFIAGPRDIIQNNVNGIIVEDDNLDQMAEKIDYLIDNPGVREAMGVNACKISEELSEASIKQRYVDYIKRCFC